MTRIIKASKRGEPGMPLSRKNWPVVAKPMRAIRSIRTLMKRDEAKGITQPEFTTTLGRAGVGSRQQSVRVVSQSTGVEAAGKNTTRVKTPDPTSGGGVRRG